MKATDTVLRELIIAANDWYDSGGEGGALLEARVRFEGCLRDLTLRMGRGEAPPRPEDVLHSLGWASRAEMCEAFGSEGEDVKAPQEPAPASAPGSGVAGLIAAVNDYSPRVEPQGPI